MQAFHLSPASRERVETIGQEFLVEFLSRNTARHPTNAAALAELAHRLTRMGRLEEGLAADRRLTQLRPDNATVHYNLGCSLALLGRLDESLDALEKAVGLGFDDAQHLALDEDLANLRDESRFRGLIRRIEQGRADLSSR